jgi:epoxyqueuosine reductase QueG
MQETENTEKLKSLCRHWGAALFGVADLRTLKRNEVLLSPDIVSRLPFGISVGFHLSDAVLEQIDDRPTPLYFHHYQRTNILLDTIGLVTTSAIQDLGCQALPVAASQLLDWKTQTAHLSHKHVARAAGLGWIGRNNLLVSKKFGARIRLVTILTNLSLVADSPSGEDCGSCKACISVCPTKAIAERPEDFNHVGCYEQLKVFSKALHLSHHICGVCVKACQGKRPKTA